MKRKQRIKDQVVIVNATEFQLTVMLRTVSFSSFKELKKRITVGRSVHLVLPYAMPCERHLIWSSIDNNTMDSVLTKEFHCFLFNPVNWLIEYGYQACFLEYILGNSVQIRKEDIVNKFITSQLPTQSVTWKISRGNVIRYKMNEPVYSIKFRNNALGLEIKSLLA